MAKANDQMIKSKPQTYSGLPKHMGSPFFVPKLTILRKNADLKLTNLRKNADLKLTNLRKNGILKLTNLRKNSKIKMTNLLKYAKMKSTSLQKGPSRDWLADLHTEECQGYSDPQRGNNKVSPIEVKSSGYQTHPSLDASHHDPVYLVVFMGGNQYDNSNI